MFALLAEKGAVQGSAAQPEITPVGRHVLDELAVRAYRTDTLSLDEVADHLGRVLTDLDEVAKRAEYFLADLGPVAPPEALPLLRPVAIALANRRVTPEILAEEFRNVWGGVEVMGGDSRDRLLAAELLNAARASMEQVYAPLMNTTLSIREKFGEKGRSVAPATILQLHTMADGRPALDSFTRFHRTGMGEEEAALLASLSATVPDLQSRRESWLSALAGLGFSAKESGVAASYLVALGADPATLKGRIQELHAALKDRHPDPVMAAALLSTMDWLEPKEIVDWLDKAMGIAKSRRLAPTPPELTALALAMVHGLPRSIFSAPPKTADPHRVSASVLAIHAWLYRPLVVPPTGSHPTPGPASTSAHPSG